MSYVDSQLLPGEAVVYRGRLHRLVFTFPAIVAALMLIVLIASIKIRQELFVAALFAAIALVTFLWSWVLYSSSEFAVTNKRVVMKVGFIRRRTLETLLSKVESIDIDQTVVGRMFDYGTIVVVGTGGSRESFNRIGEPLEFRRQVQAAIAAREEIGAPAARTDSGRKERKCPFCAEMILADAKICRFCNRDLPAAT
ncbi:MAG TPA: PH domain-containing protein [Gemmatimonadaceae bacterium]|jgi:uncharacterized membrane protein YdbT with pleckstrin-like domain